MKSLDDYFALQKQIFDYFGYVEDWRAIPLDDCREMYWSLDGEGPGTIRFAVSEEALEDEDDAGDYYEDEIYMQRHLPKWVYRGEEYTMVCCNPSVDGNTFLRVFTNANERHV